MIHNNTLKPLYLLLFTLLLTKSIYAQCGDVSVDDLTSVGPYNYDSLRESDGIRNGPDYTDATLYYPTDATGPYASIVIIPGYQTQSSLLLRWGRFYASHGIVAFVVNVNSITDFPNDRADALLDAIETIKQENTRSNSPLEGQIDTTKFAVSGHSMGGGGAQLAATKDTSINAVIPLNPWLPNSGILAGNESATLIFSGENDTTASPGSHSNRHYDNTPETTDKVLFEINNGNHQSAFSPTSSNGIVGKVALAWLKIYLEESSCYCDVLTDDLLTNSPITSKVETSYSCSTLGTDNFEDQSVITIFPNPASTNVTVKNIQFSGNANYNITNISGQLVMSGDIASSRHKIDISNLAPSVYFLNIGDSTFKVVKTN